MIRVVFLDIDGVLVTLGSIQRSQSGVQAEPERGCVLALNSILGRTGAKVVVSSTWRLGRVRPIREILTGWGVQGEVIGVTPNLRRGAGGGFDIERGDEIGLWLAGHPEVVRFVILDDSDDMGPLSGNLVRTDFRFGLTERGAERAIRILSGENL